MGTRYPTPGSESDSTLDIPIKDLRRKIQQIRQLSSVPVFRTSLYLHIPSHVLNYAESSHHSLWQRLVSFRLVLPPILDIKKAFRRY